MVISNMTRWGRALTSRNAPLDAINQGLHLVYGAALLVLSFKVGLSVSVTVLSVALLALRLGGLRVSRKREWTPSLSYLLLLAEFVLLILLSRGAEGEWSATLFLIFTASVMLNHPAHVAFPFVFTGYVLYLIVVERQTVGMSAHLLSLLNFSVVPLSLFAVRVLINQRQQIMELNAHIQSQAALTAEMTKLRERNSLAEEVHDTIGHTLTASIVSLEGATVLLSSRPAEAAVLLDTVREQLQMGLGDIRQTVRALKTDALAEEATLQESLAQLVERVCRQTSVTIDLRQRLEADLLPIQDYVLYSVVREGITNALRHASATLIQITLEEVAQHRIALTIVDNGVGAHAPVPGFGLSHLRQKVTALGGILVTETPARGGFRLAVVLPLALNRWARLSQGVRDESEP